MFRIDFIARRLFVICSGALLSSHAACGVAPGSRNRSYLHNARLTLILWRDGSHAGSIVCESSPLAPGGIPPPPKWTNAQSAGIAADEPFPNAELATYQMQVMAECSLLLWANGVGMADLGSTEAMVRPFFRTILLETARRTGFGDGVQIDKRLEY